MSQAARPFTTVRVQDAVGAILCYDITRIVPGASKGPVFRKGHRILVEDIPVLLEVGKEHLYVYEPRLGLLHEDDAAQRIRRACAGQNLHFSAPQEGRINFYASCQGLLHIMVVVTGGMSVDPDDRSPAAIRAAGGEVVSYGAPAFPGAMFMLAYIGDVPVLGLPGCVMYHKASIFDLIVHACSQGFGSPSRISQSSGMGVFAPIVRNAAILNAPSANEHSLLTPPA